MASLQVKDTDSHTPGINESLRNAKLLLKKSKRVDYYKLLEISQDANDYDIKKVAPFTIKIGLCCLMKAAGCHPPVHARSVVLQLCYQFPGTLFSWLKAKS